MQFNKKYIFIMYFLMQNGFAFGVINLTKVLYHEGNLADRLVFHTSQKIDVNVINQKSDTDKKAEIKFTLKELTITPQAQKMLNTMQRLKKGHYTVRCSVQNNNMVECSIEYDPKYIAIEHMYRDLITREKGFIISFHNKDVLEKLNLKTDSILKYAQAPGPSGMKIMIDAGHGKDDAGATSCFGVPEKTVTLQISQEIADCLERAGYDVFMTRTEDIHVALNTRTTLANKKKVDFFVSIHGNSSLNRDTKGIETFWTPQSEDPTIYKSLRIALDMERKKFAECLQEHIVSSLKKSYSGIVNRGVKKSTASVLLGTDMLSVLVELGFLSNSQEAKLLSDPSYQRLIAQGICAGIDAYCAALKNS